MVVLIMRLKAIVCSGVLCGALACAAVRPVTVQETTTPRPEPDRVVDVVAERFLFTPSQITVEAGTRLEIRLTSEDTDHGFRIIGPGDINVAIPKRGRGEAIATFVATEPGEYRFECSRVCGAGHNYMNGVIRVTLPPSEQPAGGGSR
jgi:cytochrome c oxidase subunit 2